MAAMDVLLYIVGVLVIVLGLAVSIALHEVGHLVPAKLFGVKVTQYMIGFGRTLFSVRRGETEYGVKAIPLGGYISMIGMFPPARPGGAMRNASTGFFNTMVQDARDTSSKSIGEDEHRAFYRLPVWKRIVIMLGGPFMNLVLAIVFYGIVLMVFGVAQLTTTIGSVSQCVLPAASTATTCSSSDPVAPGLEAGIRPGDKLVTIDGTAVTSWDQATARIRDSAGEPLDIVVERDGQEVALTATPLLTERYVTDAEGKILEDANGDPRTQKVGFLGIGPTSALVPQPATAVLPMVGDNITAVVGIIAHLPQRLVDVANAAFGPGSAIPTGRSAWWASGASPARSRASRPCRSPRGSRACSASSPRSTSRCSCSTWCRSCRSTADMSPGLCGRASGRGSRACSAGATRAPSTRRS
ncbi:hypothetical protein GCM10025866_00660 [Naasia aerilata]|uniref:Uncharacterized protein n=1 Tax=Naasia aerilata TaxID=1162966 RepID=A0ABM8G7P5_9MICO|nr:hypothetical protein GCM10025866_00660 [Naasia aerilata]